MEIVQLTTAAQEHAKTLLGKEKEPKAGLRIAVIGGGCSGLSYKLGWDEPSERDEVHNYENGLLVMLDEKSVEFLKGSTLEFHNSIEQQGFEVVNPNATGCCGCGNSFSCG